MRELFTVTADELNFHSKPGGPDTLTGKTAKKGEKFTVKDVHFGTQVKWVQTLGGTWLAAENRDIGVKFGTIERVPLPPKPEPAPETSPLFKIEAWQIGAFAVFIVVVALFVFW